MMLKDELRREVEKWPTSRTHAQRIQKGPTIDHQITCSPLMVLSPITQLMLGCYHYNNNDNTILIITPQCFSRTNLNRV